MFVHMHVETPRPDLPGLFLVWLSDSIIIDNVQSVMQDSIKRKKIPSKKLGEMLGFYFHVSNKYSNAPQAS